MKKQEPCEKPGSISKFVIEHYEMSFENLMSLATEAFPGTPEERIFTAIRAVYFFRKEWDGKGDIMEAYYSFWGSDWQFRNIIKPMNDAAMAEHEKGRFSAKPEKRIPTEEDIAKYPAREKAPKLFTRMVGLAGAVREFVDSGFEITDDDEYEKRLSVCKTCESMTGHGVCLKCGCFMKIKAKMAVMVCPLKKW